ncbi:gluconokinase [Sphingomonas sp. Tas61C01]|uniref:gluconokinase n=1 Tax=Sphingomonas sp. Tas61C01 TaxID=3458297 RepID=UPI00403EE092
MVVIVMGVSGSGKSTLGAALATALDRPFLEGDAYHDASSVAKMRSGEPLCDEDRWPWLDRLGAAVSATVAERGIAVVACSALKRRYRERLIAAIAAPVRFVLLDNSREELERRLAGRARHYMPPSLLDSQLATLERPAPDEAAASFDAGAPLDQLCEQTLAWLRTA